MKQEFPVLGIDDSEAKRKQIQVDIKQRFEILAGIPFRVSARDMFEYLAPCGRFSIWCNKRLSGFTEDKDFAISCVPRPRGRPLNDFLLTIDCAQAIAKLEKSENGDCLYRCLVECENEEREDLMTVEEIRILREQVKLAWIEVAIFNTNMANLKEQMQTLLGGNFDAIRKVVNPGSKKN